MKNLANVNLKQTGIFLGCMMLAAASAAAFAQAPATPAAPPADATPAAAPAPATPPAAAAPAATPAGTCTLTLKIKGLRNAKGRIAVVLYSKDDGFPMDPSAAMAHKLADVDPKTLTATVAFDGLAAGNYAAVVLHDENLVGHMEFDSQGIPLEGYGVTNNPDSSSGPPSFDASKVAVAGPDTASEISMVYWQ